MLIKNKSFLIPTTISVATARDKTPITKNRTVNLAIDDISGFLKKTLLKTSLKATFSHLRWASHSKGNL